MNKSSIPGPLGPMAYLLPVALSLIISCVNIGDKTYGELEPDDIPGLVTYGEHVRDIIGSKCSVCHSAVLGRTEEGLDYDLYENVVPQVSPGNGDGEEEDKKGWQGIKKTGIDEKSMPPGGKERFTPREIEILITWEKQGFIE